MWPKMGYLDPRCRRRGAARPVARSLSDALMGFGLLCRVIVPSAAPVASRGHFDRLTQFAP